MDSLTKDLEALAEKALGLEGLINKAFTRKEEEKKKEEQKKEEMTSRQNRYRTDLGPGEDLPEEMRSEPIATPGQGRRFFSRRTGRTGNGQNFGSRTVGRQQSGFQQYTGNFTQQNRTNPFTNQSARYTFNNNNQARPSYQSPLE